MDENSKKRYRKEKLVPRELDSDDENIAVMQKEIEQELVKLKATSLLKKLSTSNHHRNNLEFSIKVEVEEFDEQTIAEEDYSLQYSVPETEFDELAIQIDSVRSLCKNEPLEATDCSSKTEKNQCDPISNIIKIKEEFICSSKKSKAEDSKFSCSSRKIKEEHIKPTAPYNTKSNRENSESRIPECTTSRSKENVEPREFSSTTSSNKTNEEYSESRIPECSTSNRENNADGEFREPASPPSSIRTKEENSESKKPASTSKMNGENSEPTEPICISNNRKTKCIYYKITDELIQKEIEETSKKTTSQADKLLEIHMRNYFGRDLKEFAQSKVDVEIQFVLKKWKVWQETFPNLRGAPLLYICYICDKAWWHLYDFKEHVKAHDIVSFTMETDFFMHECSIVAYELKKPMKKVINIDSNCWRCEKGIEPHRVSFYICSGCDRTFQTCMHLALHEGNCSEYRRMFFEKNATLFTFLVFMCPVCPWKHWSEETLQNHLIRTHSVRSDLPINWVCRCTRCGYVYDNGSGHKCTVKNSKEFCSYCSRKFLIRHDMVFHSWVAPKNFKCRVCGKMLKKECMEAEHLLEHSESYTLMYKCVMCTNALYFLDKQSVKNHKNRFHSKRTKTIESYFDKLMIPISLIVQLKPIVEADTLKEVKRKPKSKPAPKRICRPPAVVPPTVTESFETACNGLMGFLDTNQIPQIPKPIENNLSILNTPNTIVFDSNMGVQITILDKRTVQEIINSNANMQVPDVIKNIKKEVEDETYTTDTKAIETTDNKSIETIEYNEIPLIKQEPVDEVNDVNGIPEFNQNNEINQSDNEDDILKTMLRIEDINLPIKFEVKEELEEIEEIEEDFDRDIISLDHSSSAAEEDVPPCKRKRGRPRKKPLTKYDSNSVTAGLSRLTKERYYRLVHDSKTIYLCTKCNITYKTFKKYVIHFVNHDYKMFSCPKCCKQCEDATELMTHLNFHIKHSFVSIRSIKFSNDNQRNNYQCKICQSVNSINEFFTHWERHLEIRSGDHRVHELSVDMHEKPLLREMIMILIDPEKLKVERRGKKLRKCKACDRQFDRRNDYKRHFIEHLLVDAYSERHIHGHLRCQICGLGFSRTDGYKRHLRDHGSLPIYKCEICDKAFSDSSNFSKHKKVHNLSVLVCDICKKKFNAKQYLIKHMEMHEVTKPLCCKNCNKVFFSSSAFKKHMRGYVKSYRCMGCSETFVSLKDKWDHMWTVHKERKYKADCPRCGSSFRKYIDVKKHLREVHNEEVTPLRRSYFYRRDD